MNQKTKKFYDQLISKINDYPDDIKPETIIHGDVTFTRPRKFQKVFSKNELISLIEETYKSL